MAITFPKNPELYEVIETPAGPYNWDGKSWCSGMPVSKPVITQPTHRGSATGAVHCVQNGVTHVWDGAKWHYLCDSTEFMNNELHYRAEAKKVIK